MFHRVLFLVATFLLKNAVADILVQPGYGQPHLPLHRSALQQATAQKQSHGHDIHYPQQPLIDPGYHLELHPIYSDLTHGHNQNILPYPLYQHQTSQLVSRPFKKHLRTARLGGVTILGPATLIGQPHIPVPVHHRFRRSSNNEPVSGAENNELVQNDVASKSSLSQYLSPVVDLQNEDKGLIEDLDEKHLKVRQSKSDYSVTGGNLLGLDPAKMYPGSHQFRSTEYIQQDPTSNANKQLRSSSQDNSQEKPKTHPMVPQIRLENLQHAMLLQSVAPHEQSIRQNYQERMSPSISSMQMIQSNAAESINSYKEQDRNSVPAIAIHTMDLSTKRNFPDPRPLPAVSHNHLVTLNEPFQKTEHAAPEPTAHSIHEEHETKIKNNLEGDMILGTTNSGKRKLRPLKYVYNYYYFVPQESYNCPCTSPNYVIYKNDDETLSNTGTMQNSVPQTTQLYQLANIQKPNDLPETRYVILPKTNYQTYYGARYTTDPSYGASPLKFYLKPSHL